MEIDEFGEVVRKKTKRKRETTTTPDNANRSPPRKMRSETKEGKKEGKNAGDNPILIAWNPKNKYTDTIITSHKKADLQPLLPNYGTARSAENCLTN